MKPIAFASSMVLATLILALSYAFYSVNIASASAPSGLPANFASSTGMTALVASATTIAATSTNCSSRVISTTNKGLMLTFDDSKTPTATIGFWHPASSTVAYDGGIYGCGAIKALSQDANSAITVAIFN